MCVECAKVSFGLIAGLIGFIGCVVTFVRYALGKCKDIKYKAKKNKILDYLEDPENWEGAPK